MNTRSRDNYINNTENICSIFKDNDIKNEYLQLILHSMSGKNTLQLFYQDIEYDYEHIISIWNKKEYIVSSYWNMAPNFDLVEALLDVNVIDSSLRSRLHPIVIKAVEFLCLILEYPPENVLNIVYRDEYYPMDKVPLQTLVEICDQYSENNVKIPYLYCKAFENKLGKNKTENLRC